MTRSYCFDIEPQWGSHAAMLESALSALAPGSLVVEHGAGVYSSPLIARYDLQVACIEEADGWRSWSQWMYGSRAKVLSRAKEAIPYLACASLVFIDGATRERADLLKWALNARTPQVIAHDTQDHQYGYCLNERAGYLIDQDVGPPTTTRWTRK
jgi:hypothetical protein